MPHLTVEYSGNLDKQINISDLLHRVHEAALATGAFEVAAVRTRAERREHYVIADDHKDNAFVAVRVRIAKGRDVETRKRIGEKVFNALCAYLDSKCGKEAPIGISLEVHEIDPTAAFRKNNLHTLVKERKARTSAVRQGEGVS
jgi:5-carboxymethyl-2-hydroxymuconate isomerase